MQARGKPEIVYLRLAEESQLIGNRKTSTSGVESHEVLGQVAFTYRSAEKGMAPCGPPSKFIGFKMGERFLAAAHWWEDVPIFCKSATHSAFVSFSGGYMHEILYFLSLTLFIWE